jgi:hypothetical protein
MRLLVTVSALVLCVLSAMTWFRAMNTSGGTIPPFTDANTYLAAGERLNAGHLLYRLQEGDRYVQMTPGAGQNALFSPPPIAVIWRPLAALPFGFAAWVVACWAALLGAAAMIAWRSPLGAIAVFLLVPAIGEQLAACNVAALFPFLLVVAWRDRRLSGLLIGLMAAIKLSPGTLAGWLLGRRDWRQLAVFAGVLVATLAVCVVGAGLASFTTYLHDVPTLPPSPMSLAGLTGMGWTSYAVLVAGTLTAALVSSKHDGLGFAIAVAASVLGTPALYGSGLVTLLGALAPIAWPRLASGSPGDVDEIGDLRTAPSPA